MSEMQKQNGPPDRQIGRRTIYRFQRAVIEVGTYRYFVLSILPVNLLL